MNAGLDPEPVSALLARAPGPLARRLDSVRVIASGLGVAVWWVGGGVRDLLRGAPTVDIDLVVEGLASAERLAGALADGLGGRLRRHERFLTSTLELADGAAFDVAAARSETYDAPGALPRVNPAGLDQDLLRRDFSINAIALRISPPPPELRDPSNGRLDLAAGILRVLHEVSFRDDPTRILRGLRFERRFGFHFDAATEAQAREVLAAGVLAAVSGERLRSDLARLFERPEELWPAFTRGAGLGLWRGIDSGLEGALPDTGRVADVTAAAATLAWTTPVPGAPSAWRLALLLLVESLPRSRRRS
ncbi:MAG: CCA tRNA nucleotidyltransferase, partial [Thermoanaerobaculia bacterium]